MSHQSLLMAKYTVHNIPFYLQPFFQIYGWIGNIGYYLINAIFRNLCRIEYIGNEHIESVPNHIFSLWHENLPLYFIAHPRFKKPNIWLTFPLWYMHPVHLMKKRIGIKELAYGASGHDGQKALALVLKRLGEGWSTFLAPDGPKGPLKELKNGVLVMSLKTGTPIIPMSFEVQKNWRIPSWDKKRYPPFFCTLKVIYGAPIIVTKENFDAMKILVASEMEDKIGTIKGTTTLPNI